MTSQLSSSAGPLDWLTLSRSRDLLRTRVGVLMVAFVAILYAFVSLLEGQMLLVRPTAYTSVQASVVTGQGAAAWWNYPALIVTAPGGVLILPFLASVTMVVVSVGVGIGMSVGLVLAYRLLRKGREGAGRSATVGSVTGLTPAMIALVTLGACCSTTAAATAGIGVVAQASGTTLQNVLANSWYLNVLQVGVLWVALIAQEQLLTVYGRIFRVDEPAPSVEATVPVDARFLVGATLRVVLLLGGVTWSLALAAEWTSPVPPALGGGYLVATLLEHLLPGFFAIAAALFAVSTYQALRGPGRTGVALRASLLVAGGSLALWVPAPIASAGVFGLGNELLGAVGFPGSWGAVVPPSVGPLALALRWGVQFAALGVFALLAAVSPERAFLPLQWTTEPRPVSGTTAVPSRERTASPSAPAPSSHDGSVSSQG